MRRFLPFLDLRQASAADVGRDVLAALATTFLAIPQGVAYALIAGLPPAVGLYASIVPTIVGSLFRSSRHVLSGPTNAISLLVGGAVAVLAADLNAPVTEIALTLALMVGIAQVLAGALRLGSLVDYISRAVVLGYITGAGVLIGIGQLHNLTGTTGARGDIVTRITVWVSGLDEVNWTATAVAAVTAALVVGIKRIHKQAPSALAALVLVTVGTLALGLTGDLMTVGDLAPVPASLPPLTLPTVFDPSLIAVAFAVTVLSLVESSSLARSIADKSGDQLDISVEFFGQGLSNISAAFTGGYPASGSLSRSALNHSAGAQTRLGGVFAGIFVAIGLLVAGPWVDRIPIAALAGLLVVVAVRLVDVPRIRKSMKASTGDAVAFTGTLIGTWTLRLDHAIYLGVVLSIILFLRRARMLVVRDLAVDDTGRLREVKPGDGQRDNTVHIVHVEGPLFFGAAGELRDGLARAARTPGVKALVVRLKRTQGLDATSAEVFATIAEQLKESDRQLVLVGMRDDTMAVLDRTGVSERIGRSHLFPTKPGWFQAMDAGVQHALKLADAPQDSPLRAYLDRRAQSRRDSAPA